MPTNVAEKTSSHLPTTFTERRETGAMLQEIHRLTKENISCREDLKNWRKREDSLTQGMAALQQELLDLKIKYGLLDDEDED